MPFNRIGNTPAGVAVAVRIHRMGHGRIALRLFQKLACHADDTVVLHARQLYRPGGHGLRTFGFPAR